MVLQMRYPFGQATFTTEGTQAASLQNVATTPRPLGCTQAGPSITYYYVTENRAPC
jgi:hypothetical protein